MIHLDTNVVIAVLNDRPPAVRARFDSARDAGISAELSIVVFHELMYGAAASARRSDNELKITLFLTTSRMPLLPFTEEDARHAADIRAHLKRLGTPIGPYDLFIAAQARRHGATLVTANFREFERIPGLTVVDWAA